MHWLTKKKRGVQRLGIGLLVRRRRWRWLGSAYGISSTEASPPFPFPLSSPLPHPSIIQRKRIGQANTDYVYAYAGLETPGIMHPHWHAASSSHQQRLISLFFSGPTTGEAIKFEQEINASKVHDVAAVLRWGLRHLQLQSTKVWYDSFVKAEQDAGFPLDAFSTLLPPLLEAQGYYELLRETLGLLGSLVAHAERNGVGGARVARGVGGLALGSSLSTISLSLPQAQAFTKAYENWDNSAQMAERLFLASLRYVSTSTSQPGR